MRGLLGALLLAPALAASIVPHGDFDKQRDREIVNKHSTDRTVAHVGLPIPSDPWSADLEEEDNALVLQLEVLASESPCGYGNVTIDGQVLPQIQDGDISAGKGSVSTTSKSVLVGSWSFYCVKVNGVPDSQMLKFVVDIIDGKTVEDVGFSVLFRQAGLTEIVNIETDLSVPDEVVANPKPEGLQPAGEVPHNSVEEDIAELDYLRSQLREIRYLIQEKQKAIAHHQRHHTDAMKADIRNCDSLKCVAKAIADHARNAAHFLYRKIGDGDEEFEEYGHPHSKHPKFDPPKHDKNHTCGPPKHGNHTFPPPPWKRPHRRPLPICRFPPPPSHHGPKPPFHHGPPPHHLPPPTPDFEGPPPHYHGPPPNHMPPPPPDFEGPPPHHHGGPPDHEPPPPEFDREQERIRPPPGDFGPRHHDGPPPFRPHRNNAGRALQIVKFTAVGFLFAFLLVALHKRNCTPKRRADRQARREERNRRRAYRRAAHKHVITRILARISGHGSDDDSEDDYEEKRQALLASAEDGMSTTMTEDITELRNAAEVVGDIVSASSSDESHSGIDTPSSPISIPASETRPLMQDFEIGSQFGDGEELPAYEDNDGSEMSSVVADGFRYTPGSTEYTPSASREGSVSDILGPDTKS